MYISDVKIVPPNTMTYLKSIGQIKVLVLDALDVTDGVWSHMSLAEALEFARELRPDTVYFVGAYHSLPIPFLPLYYYCYYHHHHSITTTTTTTDYAISSNHNN